MFQVVVFALMGWLATFATADDSSLETRIANSYAEMVELNAKAKDAPKAGSQSAAILNVNLGLLTGTFAYVPHYATRKKVFAEHLRKFIQDKKVDLVFIQELWYRDDFEAVLKLAKAEKFLPVLSLDDWATKVDKFGMQILVRESALKKDTGVKNVTMTKYEKKTGLESLAGYHKALLSATVTLASGRNLLLADTHLSATVGANAVRQAQVAQMAKELKVVGKNHTVLFGADFNVSPEFEDALAKEVKQWEENRAPYVEFHEATHLIDAFKALHPKDRGYTWDKRTNTLISDGPSAIKDEPLQRTDFIWAGTLADKQPAAASVFVEAAEVVFTEATIEAGKGKVHLTDHFGVFARVTFF